MARGRSRILQYFSRFGPFERAWKRRCYPGLRIASGVTFQVAGRFDYGAACTLDEGAYVIVGDSARLSLGDYCYAGRYSELGPQGVISIGDYTTIQDRCIVLGDVALGRYCKIAPNVLISSGRHYFELDPPSLIMDQDEKVTSDPDLRAHHSRPITIEDDCWIGMNAVVMPGVTIRKGAIVGAGAIVARDVAPYSVVAGAPAREIRKRLNFVPPHRIHHAEPETWPYFYAGFEMTRASIERHAQYGGIRAHGSFQLELAHGSGPVHLKVRRINPAPCSLILGTECHEVGAHLHEIVFANAHGQGGGHSIRLRTEPADAAVILSEAWVQ